MLVNFADGDGTVALPASLHGPIHDLLTGQPAPSSLALHRFGVAVLEVDR